MEMLQWAGGAERATEEKTDLTDEIRERTGREITTQQVGQSGSSREGSRP